VRTERSRLGERSSLKRAAPGRLSGTAAKLRRLFPPPLLRLATAPHIVSSRFGWNPTTRLGNSFASSTKRKIVTPETNVVSPIPSSATGRSFPNEAGLNNPLRRTRRGSMSTLMSTDLLVVTTLRCGCRAGFPPCRPQALFCLVWRRPRGAFFSRATDGSVGFDLSL
jgi:hypothetical protein